MTGLRWSCALFVVSGVLAASPACAACDCRQVRNIVGAGVETVNEHTSEVGGTIAQTILDGVAQLSGYSLRATEAQKRVMEAAQINAVSREKQLARGLAESGRYDPAASACLDLSGIFSIGQSGGGVGLSGRDITNASRNWSYGNEDIGKPVAQGGLSVANAIITDRDRFKGVGGFADPTSDARLLTDAMTLDTSRKEIAGAHIRLVNNIVDPIPAKPITALEGKTPTGSAELADWARKAAPQGYPYAIGEAVSQLQAIDIFVRSRFANAKWHQQLAQMSPDAVQREQLLATVLTQQIEWMRFDLERRNAVAIAALLSSVLDPRDAGTTNIPLAPVAGH